MPGTGQRGRSGRGPASVRRLLLLFLLGAFGIFLPQATAFATPFSIPDTTWVTDGRVSAIERVGDEIYIGGNFRQVGPNTGFGVALYSGGGTLDGAFPNVNGRVLAVTPDGSGGWYIGGEFQRVGGSFRPGIAHVLSDGTTDPDWNPKLDGTVDALAASPDGTKIYAGGNFTTVDGEARSNLVALDAATGEVDQSWTPSTNGTVDAIAIAPDGGRVYVGGAFTSVNGVARGRLASLDPVTGAVDGSWSANANNTVYALAISPDGSRLYAGGRFTNVRGISRGYLAEVSPVDGSVDPGWNPGADAAVNTLAVSNDGSLVYAGGDFTSVNGAARSRIAAIDASNGLPTAWNPGANKTVNAIALSPDGSLVYAGGNFTVFGHASRNRLAAVRAASGTITSWNPNANGPVIALAPSSDGDLVYAGGGLTSVGGVKRSRLAAIDATTGTVDPDWNPGANGAVYTLAASPDGTKIYAGGNFTSVGGVPHERLVALDPTTGAADAGWDPSADGVVRSIVVSGNRIYVGGDFLNVNGQSRSRLALLDAATGALDPLWAPSAGAIVRTMALAPDGGRLYVGGDFTGFSGQTRKYLVAVDPVTGALDPLWKPASKRPVLDLAVSGTGVFAAQGGPGGGAVSAYGTSGQVLWSVAADGDCQAITLVGDRVYVGGHFELLGGQSLSQAAALDAATGSLDPGWQPDVGGNTQGGRGVWALAAFGTQRLYMGGDFTKVSGRSQQGFAQFSG
ncbi:WD40 repeat domain-containing protein [Rubrobacter calidifluminis]|uniref:WD40 repeat domain-containing protein n=1 Tax=Rubrobacter calidifluminis TaxID=1392640 RepID=UPI002362237E|nr:hypothetical protein [Rubrobacter calidifluminis]